MELATVCFGDARLNERAKKVLASLGQKPSGSIPMASGGWSETKAAYRFFGNEKVSSKKVLAAHLQATLARMKEHEVILFPQDTTEINYAGHKSKTAIGVLRNEKDFGYILHPTIAITPERLVLGVIDAQYIYRETLSQEARSKSRTLEEKESYKWIKSYEKVREIAKLYPEKTMISISDREGDIYEFLSKSPDCEEGFAHWIIRSAQERKLVSEAEENKELWETMASAPTVGEISFKISRENEIHSVTQEIRINEVELKAPYRKGTKLANIKIYAVLATEINSGKASPMEWLLLTSLKVESFEQAVKVIEYYCARWDIEIFFKVLKSGCQIEELQLETKEALEPCMAIYMIVAWRVLYVMFLGRECPEMPADIIFHEYEWKSAFRAAKKQVPKEIPQLGEMIKVIAILGGYLDRKSDGPPGCKVMWIGLQRLKDIAFGWEIAHEDVALPQE